MSTEAPQTTRELVETVLADPQERTRLLDLAASRYGIQTQDAEDLVQETAFDLLRQRLYVHSPRGFLYTVFRRRCAHFIRDKRTRTRALDSVPELAVTIAREAEDSHRRFAVREALTGVSITCRKLLAVYYVQGRSLREAAACMTMAYSGVANTISRCLRRLRACLN